MVVTPLGHHGPGAASQVCTQAPALQVSAAAGAQRPGHGPGLLLLHPLGSPVPGRAIGALLLDTLEASQCTGCTNTIKTKVRVQKTNRDAEGAPLLGTEDRSGGMSLPPGFSMGLAGQGMGDAELS